MEDIIHELEERLKENIRRQILLKQLLQDCPEGRIDIVPVKGHYRYYWAKGGKRKYIRKSESETITALIGKTYHKEMLRAVEKEMRTLRVFLSAFDPGKQAFLYEKQSEERKKHIDPLVLPDDLFVKRWIQESESLIGSLANSYPHPEEFQTRRGEFVRSKSEKILADTFSYHGIAYVYECPLNLKDGVVFPDFKLLNRRTRKTVYWEHFGMMDDPDYLEAALQKIQRYERSGFFIGDTLIVTFETSRRPLGTKEIELLIQKYLL